MFMDLQGDKSLAKIPKTDTERLTDWFRNRYSTLNFYQCFSFIKHYVDLDKSHQEGKIYAKNIYANLCMRVKLNIDWHKDGKLGEINSDADLNEFISGMAINGAFDHVKRHHFVEVIRKRTKSKAPIKAPAKTPKEGERFHIA
jgi:hypothetical protein